MKIITVSLLVLCLLNVQAQTPFLAPGSPKSDMYVSPASDTTTGRAKNTRTTYSNPPRVRVAYLVPYNRTPQKNYKENLQFAIEMAQMWYRSAMQQNGFGPKTFIFETEDDSPRPKIHLVNVPQTDSNLWGGDGYTLFERTRNAAKNAGLTVDSSGEVWILIPETHVQKPTGSFIGGLALGGGGQTGNNSGIAQVGSIVIQLFDPQKLMDNTPYAGHIVPEWGPYPLVQDSSFVWFEGTTFSSVASSYMGALIHEMGHAFGLSHDFRNDNNFFGGLMGNGLRGIRGSFFPSLYPNDYTRLEYGSSLQLNESHYFNRDKIVNTALSTLKVVNGSSVIDGLLNIDFNAGDSDSIAYAQLFNQNGEIIDELEVNKFQSFPTFIMGHFKTPYYTAGGSNAYTIAACDKQGNRRRSETFSITVPLGSNRAPRPFLKILYPNAPYAGNNSLFDVLSTVDPDGDSFTTEIDFNNDGIFDTAPLYTRTNYFEMTQSGPYMSRIRVTDSHGASALSSPISGNFGNTCGVELPKPTIKGIQTVCPGSPTLLTAQGCYGTLLWSTGATSTSISVSPTTTTAYSVTCRYGCAYQESLPITVETVPENILLSGSAPSGIQRANQTLVSSQQIPAGNTVLYTAEKSITLLPGFEAGKQGLFSTTLKNCNAPIANADKVVATLGFLSNLNILNNDRNPDGTPVTDTAQTSLPIIIVPPSKGTANVTANGSINYTANADNDGNDHLVYSICNKFSPSSCATASVVINAYPFSYIKNNNFESEVTFTAAPWLKGGTKPGQAVFSWLTGGGRNESNCIQLDSGPSEGPTDANDVYVYQQVILTAFTNYVLKGWVKTQNITTAPNGLGAYLTLTVFGSNVPLYSTGLTGSNDWTELSIPFYSGNGGYITIYCRLGSTDAEAKGTAFFDDLRLEMP